MPYSGLDIFSDNSSRLPPEWPFEKEALEAVLGWTSNMIIMDHDNQSYQAYLRFLSEDDHTQFVEFHNAVISNLSDPQVLRADKPEFLQAHLEKRGRTIGVFLKSGEMIAYGVVSFPKGDIDNLGPIAGLDGEEKLRVAHFDGAAVDGRFRGNSIHRVFNCLREQCAMMAGYYHLMCTISPANIPCLQNQIENGFKIVNIAKKYDNLDRFIALKSERLPRFFFDLPTIEIDLADRTGLFEKLPQNWVGHKILESEGVYKLVCSEL